MSSTNFKNVSIIGAGPAGLMAADVLSAAGVCVSVFEAKPSVGRKFLMAGKGGLNITHSEDLYDFIGRYDQSEWLAPMLRAFDAEAIRQWMAGLGVESFIGTSGRVFPTEMKAAPLLRHWLADLKKRGVRVHCRHYWQGFSAEGASRFVTEDGVIEVSADATILALGGGSWPSLGSDASWVSKLQNLGVLVNPLMPSNGGFDVAWSAFMSQQAGSPVKNIIGWVEDEQGQKLNISQSELMITGYGVEGGLIYALSRSLRELLANGVAHLYLDLLPNVTIEDLTPKLTPVGKETLSNVWRKAGLDGVKAALVREVLPKSDWVNAAQVAKCAKSYMLPLIAMQPMDTAISTAGGVTRDSIDERLMLHALPNVYCCGEMLDWDAPTGGYLLSACFASGRWAAQGVLAAFGLD